MAFKLKSQSTVKSGGFKMMGSSPLSRVDTSKPADHKHDDTSIDTSETVASGDSAPRAEVSNIQKVQTALTGVEMLGGHPLLELASMGAGGVNANISFYRGLYDLYKGDKESAKSNMIDAGLSTIGLLPVVGWAGTSAKIARQGSRIAGTYGGARHLDDGVTWASGGTIDAGDALSFEKEGGGVGEGSRFRDSFNKKFDK